MLLFGSFSREIDKWFGHHITPKEDYLIFRGNIMNPSGIYKKSFLDSKGIRHNNTQGAPYQDLGFWFHIMVNSTRGMLIDDVVYYYRQDNSASSMNDEGKLNYCVCYEYDHLREIDGGKIF